MDYRYKENLDVIRFPKGFEEEDRGFKECCCEEDALASLSSSDSWKNDFKGVYVKKSAPSDIVAFTIEKCNTAGLLANLGTVSVFPNEANGVGFVFDWKQYLSTYGAGKYTIKVQYTISGVVGGYTFGTYNLKPYSITSARGTVRIKSIFNSFFLPDEFDFTNSGFTDTIRFGGFFGSQKPNTQINNLIDKGRVVEKTTRENLNIYELKTNPLQECISRPLIDFHLLSEDECFITDNNQHNHSYKFEDFPVVVEEDVQTEYPEFSRFVNITAIFGDRKKQSKSYYNG